MALPTFGPIHGFPLKFHGLQDNRPGVGVGECQRKSSKSQDIKKKKKVN